MIDRRIKLRHLQLFVEVANRQSLSMAADMIGISQPAASQTLKELETILEAKLFDREGRSLRLNRQGRILQQLASSALHDLEKGQDLIRGAKTHSTRIAVGLLPTVATDIFPRAALEFRNTHPDCHLRIATGPNWSLLAQLRDGSLDVVLGRMSAPEQMMGLSFRQLFTDQILAIVRPDHPLLGQSLTPQDLTNYPLMLPPTGAVISSSVRAWLLSKNLQTVEPAFENVSLAFGRKTVMLSDTVWFISRAVIADELDAGRLAALDLGDPLLGGPVGVSVRDQSATSPELTALIDTLEQTVKTAAPHSSAP